MIKFNKKIIGTIIIVVCSVLGVFWVSWFFIKQEAPLFEGIWTNEDESFILDTEIFTATITTDDSSETLVVAYTPGTNFAMYYSPPEGTTGIYAGDFIHTGDIYRIKFFGIDYIRVKCKDGCFDVWLKKV
ncbi:MAG: hypothetical protein J1F03_09195 [Oscillospiraceae bacterium]|nr:hypothetical protein [Oscillospiraceae bacterium]